MAKSVQKHRPMDSQQGQAEGSPKDTELEIRPRMASRTWVPQELNSGRGIQKRLKQEPNEAPGGCRAAKLSLASMADGNRAISTPRRPHCAPDGLPRSERLGRNFDFKLLEVG